MNIQDVIDDPDMELLRKAVSELDAETFVKVSGIELELKKIKEAFFDLKTGDFREFWFKYPKLGAKLVAHFAEVLPSDTTEKDDNEIDES